MVQYDFTPHDWNGNTNQAEVIPQQVYKLYAQLSSGGNKPKIHDHFGVAYPTLVAWAVIAVITGAAPVEFIRAKGLADIPFMESSTVNDKDDGSGSDEVSVDGLDDDLVERIITGAQCTGTAGVGIAISEDAADELRAINKAWTTRMGSLKAAAPDGHIKFTDDEPLNFSYHPVISAGKMHGDPFRRYCPADKALYLADFYIYNRDPTNFVEVQILQGIVDEVLGQVAPPIKILAKEEYRMSDHLPPIRIYASGDTDLKKIEVQAQYDTASSDLDWMAWFIVADR